MKYSLSLLLLFIIVSCSNEIGELRTENAELIQENDSLNAELNKIQILPFVHPNDLGDTRLGRTASIQFLAINKGGFLIDSVKLKGFTNEYIQSHISTETDMFGSKLLFDADSVGEYRFTVYTRLENDNHTVVYNIPIEIIKEPNTK